MTHHRATADAVIIGGGFYGVAIGVYLAKSRGLRRVILLEQEKNLLSRASYNNQARVHNGYHYPRSFTTAFRSRVNYPRFVKDWQHAVSQDFVKLYAIAKRNSKVTARQFERFCHEIGATIKPLDSGLSQLFEPRLIEKVFLVEECAFDSIKLAEWASSELHSAGVEVIYSTRAESVHNSHSDDKLNVAIKSTTDENSLISCRYVFNCTYSGLNQLQGDFKGTQTSLKHEITEMALLKLPDEFGGAGVTVMDGPFFSIMPFPARGMHTLSHVRYTPHFNWQDSPSINPYQKLIEYDCATRVDWMLRDVSRYIPLMRKSEYVESLFEVKTVLVKNEGDDGRPILFEKHADLPGCFSVLGGKIDNIYDVIEKLDQENIQSSPLF